MLIADFILIIHVMVVVFNVGGLLAILIGAPLVGRGYAIAAFALRTSP